MKQIKLEMDPPFSNRVDVNVLDFPNGLDESPRKRCAITVEYAEVDIKAHLREGLDREGLLEYYRDWIYNLVKVHISSDWEPVSGLEEVMVLVETKIDEVLNKA